MADVSPMPLPQQLRVPPYVAPPSTLRQRLHDRPPQAPAPPVRRQWRPQRVPAAAE